MAEEEPQEPLLNEEEEQEPQQEELQQEEEPYFSLYPGISHNEVIDMSTKEGAKFYERATSSIFDATDKFDCTAQNMHSFLKEFNR